MQMTLIVYRYPQIKGKKCCLDYPISKVNEKVQTNYTGVQQGQFAIPNVSFLGAGYINTIVYQ